MQSSTLFLRCAIILMGLAVMALCVLVLPQDLMAPGGLGYRPIIWGMYVTAIPFFIALYQGLKLLHYIDKNNAFSKASIKALAIIKYCALSIGVLYTAGMPYIYAAAQEDDAPGVIVIGLVFAGTSLVIAVFSALLQKLLQNAITMKSENDLTV